MRITLDLELPESLYKELIAGCLEASCHPKIFAAEALESVLAARRLPHVTVGRYGPRIGNPVTLAAVTEEDSERITALCPSDIPTADELDSLQSIG